MRLIDADALERAVMFLGEDSICNDCAYEFVSLIDEQPTIEAEAKGKDINVPTVEAEHVRRGRWLPHPTEKDWRVCSVCGQGTEIVRHEAGATTEYCYKHCPWCGAKMDKGD